MHDLLKRVHKKTVCCCVSPFGLLQQRSIEFLKWLKFFISSLWHEVNFDAFTGFKGERGVVHFMMTVMGEIVESG